MAMRWPDCSLWVQFGRLLRWALRKAWHEIPAAMRTTTFARPVSEVPFWLAAGNPLANHPWDDRPDARLPGETEVVVIGSGLAGSAVAYHWSKRAGAGRTLTVVEMDDVASGSAGRNEGLVVMGRYYYMVYSTVLKHLPEVRPDLTADGHDQLARQFAAVYCRGCYRNGDLVENTVREEGFACDYAREGWVQGCEAHQQTTLQAAVRMAMESGFTDWTEIDPAQVKERSGMNVRHNAGFSLAAASFHPAKWCWCLVRRALEAGNVALYSRTRVSAVEDAGEHYVVRTARGDIRARHVVTCTESYTPLLFSAFRGLIRPTQTQAATGDGGPPDLKPHVGVSGSEGFFGRHGDTVLVGTDATRVPDRQAGRIQPSRFLTKFCVAEMQRMFGRHPYHVTHEWSGTVSYTPDEYPVVGLVDGKRHYMIGGMAGSGTAVGFNAARCIVNRILGMSDEPDDFPPEYFAPSRLLDPVQHPWPEMEP